MNHLFSADLPGVSIVALTVIPAEWAPSAGVLWLCSTSCRTPTQTCCSRSVFMTQGVQVCLEVCVLSSLCGLFSAVFPWMVSCLLFTTMGGFKSSSLSWPKERPAASTASYLKGFIHWRRRRPREDEDQRQGDEHV